MQQAAEQGDTQAQYILGECYANGKGVPQFMLDAAKWFRLAAEQGHPEAQLKLGTCYYYGAGVALDKAEAVKWFRLAAEQDDAEAAEYVRRLQQVGVR